LAAVCLSISLRALFLYSQLRSPRLFILGLAMGLVALAAAADFASGFMTSIPFNIDWFLFLGQAISFGFIFLSLLRSSDHYLRHLILWQIISTSLVLFLLFLAPVLPDFPSTTIRVLLSGSRAVGCFLIFGYYASAFVSKETRFSLMISASFLLLSIGYALILPHYLLPHQEGLDYLGDGMRIVGLMILMAAYVKG
jgi:hypothetical protein